MAQVACPRPNKQLMQIAYKILKTPRTLQQDEQRKPSEKLQKEWLRDSMLGQ